MPKIVRAFSNFTYLRAGSNIKYKISHLRNVMIYVVKKNIENGSSLFRGLMV